MRKKRLGEILCERGQISAADLKQALQEQQGKVIHLGELLLQRKLVSESDLATALAEVSAVEYVDCHKADPRPEIVKLIPAALAKRCRAVPIAADGKTLTVVMAERRICNWWTYYASNRPENRGSSSGQPPSITAR